jgi:hypothetical protein
LVQRYAHLPRRLGGDREGRAADQDLAPFVAGLALGWRWADLGEQHGDALAGRVVAGEDEHRRASVHAHGRAGDGDAVLVAGRLRERR